MKLHESIDFRAAYNHIVRTQLILIIGISLLFFKIYLDQRGEISTLKAKFENRDIMLVSSREAISYGKLNQVPFEDVKTKAKDVVNTIANLTPETVREKYLALSRIIPEQKRGKFLQDSKARIDYIEQNGVFESVKNQSLKFVQTGPMTYRATAVIELNIVLNDILTGTKQEVIEFDVQVVRPTENDAWFLEIEKFKRLSQKQYSQLQEVK